MKPSSTGKTSAASIAARLRNAAGANGITVEMAREQFAREAFFRRLMKSPYANDFILKGSMLLVAWLRDFYRPTLDVDFLVRRALNAEELRGVIGEIANISDDDRVVFDPKSIRIEAMQEGLRHAGQRISMRGSLGSGELIFRCDIGFSDVVTPKPALVEMRGLFDDAIKILGSTVVTVIAEKYDAMTNLGLANTRTKDYYDVMILARTQAIDGNELVKALRTTFANRQRTLPRGWDATLDGIPNDEKQQRMWKRLLSSIKQAGSDSLEGAIADIRAFLTEPLTHVDPLQTFARRWKPGSGWR